jgi:hypothetical protein
MKLFFFFYVIKIKFHLPAEKAISLSGSKNINCIYCKNYTIKCTKQN